MNAVQYLRLVGDARAFLQSAGLIENEIRRLSVRQGDLSPIGGSTGWPSHSVWESLKTVSHFNLAISLELRLKCLLHLHGIAPVTGRDGHLLAKLYDRIFESRRDTVEKLESLFCQAIRNNPFELVAFLSTDSPAIPERPCDRELNGLRDFLVYMDEDVELWKKRYSWEMVAEKRWRHYVDNLDAFWEFLDATERFAAEMARKNGLVN